MREHMGLFRGKRIDNGEWVEGYYSGYGLICPNEPEDVYNAMGNYYDQTPYVGFVEVDPTTIGECTGLKDKNGKLIWEWDIVKTHYANVKKADFVEIVVFHNGKFCALYEKGTSKMWCPLADGVPHHPGDKSAYMEWCEVIGNIHDNPELLKGDE